MIELRLNVGADADADYISEILLNLGALSAVVTDRNRGTALEEPIFHEPNTDEQDTGLLKPVAQHDGQGLWKEAIISAFFDAGVDVEHIIMSVLSDFDVPQTPTLKVANVGDVPDDVLQKDWITHVHRSFTSVIEGRIRIRAPWHRVNDTATHQSAANDPLRPGEYVDLVIEPGQAFGTGEHPTTRLVLAWLQEYAAGRPEHGSWNVLDYGCGSGILALAALKLGARSAVGCDIDPLALSTARKNADINLCEPAVTFGTPSYEASMVPHEGYAVVVANILAGPLKSLADLLCSRVAPGGRLAMSGILASQATEVVESFQALGMHLETSVVRSGWAVVVLSKPKP